MPLETVNELRHDTGDEERDRQPVSQWMCDVCVEFDTVRFDNPVVTQCFVCKAFLCESCVMYERFRYRRNLVTGQKVPLYPRAGDPSSTCSSCWTLRAWESPGDSDEGSDSGRSDDSRSPIRRAFLDLWRFSACDGCFLVPRWDFVHGHGKVLLSLLVPVHPSEG